MAPKLGLTNGNFKWIADQLDWEPEVVIAFSRTECKRAPFDADGFPAILFERHIFWRHADRSKRDGWYRQFPDICNPNPTPAGGYGSYAVQRVKFSKAFRLDTDAAMEACSWGAFQELGQNYADYGFGSVDEFVDTMRDGLYGQCDIFVRSIRHRGLVDDGQRKSWATMAALYNGSSYRKFGYDTQLKENYTEAKDLRIDWASVASEPPERGSASASVIQTLSSDPGAFPAAPDSGGGADTVTSAPPSDQPEKPPEQTPTPAPEPAPSEKIAIVRRDVLKNFEKKLGALFGGNVSLDVITDKLKNAQAIGLSERAWAVIFELGLAASAVWVAVTIIKHFWVKRQQNLLIHENSTPGNTVTIIDEDKVADFQDKGYKIVSTS